jgi:hypothetical protein
MQIVKSEFLSAMKKAMPGVESSNNILQGVDTYIFHNGHIYTYNDQSIR